jgi:hypothetical protein
MNLFLIISLFKKQQMPIIVKTIEECWDIDLDARVSAECALARIKKIYDSLPFLLNQEYLQQ